MDEDKQDMTGSWTVVSQSQKEADEVDPEELNTPEVNHHSAAEDSDGISIISESEFGKALMSTIESENEEKDEVPAVEEFQLPLTPPSTPKIDEIKEESDSSEPCNCEKVFISKVLLFGAGFFIVVAYFYSHVNYLKVEIAKCNDRISQLEVENQILREALTRFELNLDNLSRQDHLITDETQSEVVQPDIPQVIPQNQRIPEPQTKKVWIGNEEEEMVEILDKKHDLPDYCYFTQEDDLFYEYNKEVCEHKKRKLEKIQEKRKQRMQKLKPKDSFDDYIADTLKSLNDEIQEIKAKRVEKTTPETPKNTKQDESHKNSQKRSERKRSRKIKNWEDQRMNGRETARRLKEDNDDDSNWFLKRNNERELDRVAKLKD